MRQVLYVSDSRIGNDTQALDRLMVQARTNNALDGITGLLWTDGKRFAQVLEGHDHAIETLLNKLGRDDRHTNFAVVHDTTVDDRQYGDWAMARRGRDKLFTASEDRMRDQLALLQTDLSAAFQAVIAAEGV